MRTHRNPRSDEIKSTGEQSSKSRARRGHVCCSFHLPEMWLLVLKPFLSSALRKTMQVFVTQRFL